MESPIIVIAGPTASGKTSLSLDLAKKFNGEIICADSMTVYKGMDIGTDKVTIQNSKFKIQNNPSSVIPTTPTVMPATSAVIPAKAGIQSFINIDSRLRGNDNINRARTNVDGIPHHLLDILNPDEEFNVAIFKDLAEREIKEIHERGNIPFLVGGSTMYIDALVYHYNIPHAKPNNDLRKELDKKSNKELFDQLIELDPDAEWTVGKNNKRRLVRALEVCLQTGEPFTAQKKKQDLPANVLYLAINRDREELYKRINSRVDEMMAEGFLDEVKKLHKKYDLNTAMQTTGYRQLIEYLAGNLTLEEAVEKTKQSHRNYAKRQLTWLRQNKDVVWIKDKEEAEDKIKKILI